MVPRVRRAVNGRVPSGVVVEGPSEPRRGRLAFGWRTGLALPLGMLVTARTLAAFARMIEGYLEIQYDFWFELGMVIGQVAFQWAATKANVGAKLIRVKLVPLTGTGRERTSAFTRKPDLTTTKMAPGAYQVQLQARRGYMNSPWTAIGRVRIKAGPVRRHS